MFDYAHFNYMRRLCKQLRISRVDSLKVFFGYYLSRLGMTNLPPFVVTLSFRGKKLRLPLRSNGADYRVLADVFVNRLYEVEERDVSKIVDLGANIGFATLYLHALYPNAEIACLEPFPDNIKILRKTLSINGIRDVHVFQAAVGIIDGTALLKVAPDPTSHSLVPGSNANSIGGIEVKQISIDSLMKTLGWKEIDLVKIDIEGYEKTLFSDNTRWLDLTRHIVGEAHAHVKYGLPEVERDLCCHGFKVVQKSRNPLYGMIVFEAKRGSQKVYESTKVHRTD